jgi:hypothetical protein
MTPQHLIEFWNDQEENDRIFECTAPVVCQTAITGVPNGAYICEGNISGVSYTVDGPAHETCKIKVFGEWVPWSENEQAFVSGRYRINPNQINYVVAGDQ